MVGWVVVPGCLVMGGCVAVPGCLVMFVGVVSLVVLLVWAALVAGDGAGAAVGGGLVEG